MSTDRSREVYDRALGHVARLSTGPPVDPGLRVTLNFHPDRPTRDGLLVVEALARDGVYRNQFVTGTSNGGLGGDRRLWERRMFGGAYDAGPAELRPVYGTLNVRADPVGGAPRFGSAHLRLRAAVLPRTTFCHPDSVFAPTRFGVAERMGLVTLAEADPPDDPLDDYVEAHVHGPVVLDCAVEWHAGFRLTVDELRRHPGYRGPRFTDLGERLAVDGVLDPRILGVAWRSGRHDDQDLKRVWHLLARFGR